MDEISVCELINGMTELSAGRLSHPWTHPAVAGQQNGVALDVPVDDALCVQVGQSPQHRQANGSDLLLVHPVKASKHTHTHTSAMIFVCFPGLRASSGHKMIT